MRIAYAIGIVASLGVASAHAEAPKMRVQRARQEALLAPDVAALNKTCGTKITARIDWRTVPDGQTGNAANYCNHALESIARLCADALGKVADPLGKAAVTKQITSVRCSYAPKRAISLKDGVLQFDSDFAASDDRSTIIEYLQGNL